MVFTLAKLQVAMEAWSLSESPTRRANKKGCLPGASQTRPAGGKSRRAKGAKNGRNHMLLRHRVRLVSFVCWRSRAGFLEGKTQLVQCSADARVGITGSMSRGYSLPFLSCSQVGILYRFVANILCAGLPESVLPLQLITSCLPSYHFEVQRDRRSSGLNFELTFAPALG